MPQPNEPLRTQYVYGGKQQAGVKGNKLALFEQAGINLTQRFTELNMILGFRRDPCLGLSAANDSASADDVSKTVVELIFRSTDRKRSPTTGLETSSAEAEPFAADRPRSYQCNFTELFTDRTCPSSNWKSAFRRHVE